jgi:hypothetical protein
MKLGMDLRKHIRRQWGDLLPQAEEIWAAEVLMPAGYAARGIGWAVPEAFGAGAGFVGQAVGTLASRFGEQVTDERAHRRQAKAGGEAAKLTTFPLVVAVTNRRFLLFAVDRGSQRAFGRSPEARWLIPVASHPPSWMRSARLDAGVVHNIIRLELVDGTVIRLESPRGLGDARSLVAAISRLRHG